MVRVEGATSLHGAAGERGGHGVGGDAVGVGEQHVGAALGVLAGQVEEVDAGEDDQEAAEETDGVDGVGGVEAAEEDEGGEEGEGREGYVVEGVYAGGG